MKEIKFVIQKNPSASQPRYDLVSASELSPDTDVYVVWDGQIRKVKASEVSGEVLRIEVKKDFEPCVVTKDGAIQPVGHPYPIRTMPEKARRVDRLWKGVVKHLLSFAHRVVKPNVEPPKDEAVREVWNALTDLIEREREKPMKDLWTQVRDIFCFLLEYDPAYYWRFKWLASRVNYQKLLPTEADLYWLSKRIDIGKEGFESRGVSG